MTESETRVCVMCGAPAVLDCPHHLGNWQCGAPLCLAHVDKHHPDSAAWEEYKKGSNAQHYINAAGGNTTGFWYAFMAGWAAAMKHSRTEQNRTAEPK